jgi:hypothetical protein
MTMLAPLLLAAAPFIGREVTWRVTSPQQTAFPATQAAPLTTDGLGYAVTWSEVVQGVSRACAGTLTSGGRIETGVCTAGTGDAAAVVPSGDGYLGAWLEPEPSDGRPQLVTGSLDRNFALRSSRVLGLAAGAPAFRITPSHVWLATATRLYDLDTDGSVLSATDFDRRVDGIAASGDQLGTVSHAHQPAPFARTVSTFYSVTFARQSGASATFEFGTNDVIDQPTAIGASESAFLVLFWRFANELDASLFGAGFAHIAVIAPHAGSAPSQPQVAWDGARWLAVWSTGNGIEGAAIAPDLTSTLFSISAEGGRPAVVASSPDHFLVTYEVLGTGERRLVSRLIDFTAPAGRGHAVR